MIRAKGRCRSVLLFLGAVAIIFSNALPAAGALLRDIRIGEYESSTRIVLEFDSEPSLISPPQIENGILTVSLAATYPKLVRRIPFENTERISNLEIIAHKDDKLEIRLLLSPRHDRLKWFSLQNPFRLAIDIELGGRQTESSQATTVGSDKPVQAQSQIADEYEIAQVQAGKNMETPRPQASPEQNSPFPAQSTSLPEKAGANHQAEDEIATALSLEKTPAEAGNESAEEQPGPEKAPAPKMPKLVVAQPPPNEPASPQGRDLQLYLVGGLVLLTVIILGLLASIIFSRNRETTEQERLAIDELLRKQEKTIEAINAQIDEEMQKFDKI